VTQELPPEGSLTFDVEALVEVHGTLVVEAPGPGFAVSVFDSLGEGLGSGTTDASGALTLDVRVGKHELRATKEGFSDFRTPVDVRDGETTDVAVQASVQAVQTSVFGTPGTYFKVERSVDGAWEAVGPSRRIEEGGQSRRPIDLEPGRYRVTWEDGARVKEFEVKAGESGKQLRLE
jgi:hypothetical protein